MNNFDEADKVNIGVGQDITIRELAMLIKKVFGFEDDITLSYGPLNFDL